jgi:ABC-type uncharacterized transport system substrate-binding protein
MIKYIFLLFLYTCVFSHPHTFIDIYPSVKKDNPKLINIKWKLDEMTSSILIMELDSNMDGKIDLKENKFIEREYFSMFKPYSYYTFIFIKGKKYPTEPKNFKASIEDNRLCYSFDIEFEVNLKNVYFEFGDPDLYNALILKDEFVDFEGLSAKITGVDKEFYYGYKLEFN